MQVKAGTVRHVRHPLWVRLAHWLTAAAFLTLAVSGFAILLALPRLFWGETGAIGAPAWVVLPLPINTDQTGWGRNLHFLSAWIFVITGVFYLLAIFLGGRLRRRLLPERDQLGAMHLLSEVQRHLRPDASEAATADTRYNALQKLAYLVVIFILAPVMLLSGLTMSPGVTAAFPELFGLFSGRQSARTVHFMSACLLLAFLVVHIWQVLANDAASLMLGMLTGRGGRRS
ncbi:cytochrome b/b6 domain-containing protein [Methylopila sp. M107]|uniref:cytochrome b/b6 domain-containing protein n=1 Tax=Methylopila sp. M107 TaxID=1101190 RepID=UPI000366398B|nr:cytochrome b/b6 domain-containing protein [Methylopila sp. M107]